MEQRHQSNQQTSSEVRERRITQSYFDQLVQENAEDFGVSRDEAVRETIEQLRCGGVPYDHLVLTAPPPSPPQPPNSDNTGETNGDGEGTVVDEERRQRADFNASLNCLRGRTTNDEHDDANNDANDTDGLRCTQTNSDELCVLETHLSTVHSCIVKDLNTYSKLWDASNGYSIYATLLRALATHASPDASPDQLVSGSGVDRILETLSFALETQSAQPPDHLKWVQQCFTRNFMQAWMALFRSCCDSGTIASVPICRNLLTVGYWSCKRNEAQKQLWMEQRFDETSSDSTNLVELLLGLLSAIPSAAGAQDDEASSLLAPLCRWITVLCRNDFDSSSDDAPLTASATSRVQQFTASGFLVPLLHGHLRGGVATTGENDQDRTVVLLQTCRALAIHNDVVVSMRQEGLVGTAIDLFESIDMSGADGALLVALVGLFRNLCANDDLKNQLGHTILPSLAFRFSELVHRRRTTNSSDSQVALHEQFCGLIAALSLRHPGNARQLVELGAVESIVACMEAHPDSGPLQRSAANAVRNMVSRLDHHQPSSATDENGCPAVHSKDELRELCQPALVRAARTHASCQEAVYAALRDLGCNDAKMSRVVLDANGRAKLVSGATTFQPGSNAGFRAVYD